MKKRCCVLLAGEQVTASGFEIKGFDYFGTNAYKEDGQAIVAAIASGGADVTWMRTCHVAVEFPEKMAELKKFDAVLLSDVGANSLLFHPEMLSRSLPHPDRLKLLRDYVRQGGGLAMVGGWMSFSGIDGRAHYYRSYLEEALPVTCSPYDDRVERPAGVWPQVAQRRHPVLRGVPTAWPFFLGYNRVTPRTEAQVVLRLDGDPLLCVWEFGKGRAAAFTSDCAPHWGPEAFLKWKGYPVFWRNLVAWLAGRD